MVDVNRADLDNLLASEDNSEDNGNDSININTLLQQLLSATTNLQSSVNEVNVTIHEMKQHQTDMQSKIDHIENVVFSADLHGTRFNKPKIGHDSDAMNEDSMQVDGANISKLDVGNDANNSKPDVGNNANNSNSKLELNKYDLNDEFDAEAYTFVNDNDDNDDVKNKNENEVHGDNEIDKTVNTLRVSFGTVNFNNGNNSDSLSNIDLDLHRNVSTELSFDGYQVVLNDKSLHFVTSPKYLSWQLTHISVHAIYVLMQKLEDFVSNTPEAALKTSSLFSTSVKRSLEAYSCIHTPILNSKSWLSINLDEAILRARLVAAPTNKGAIIQELQQFKRPFDDRLSLAPDRLPNIWATMMTWVKEFERYYYLCTFYDYSKNVYGLAPNQQPENTGQFGVITVMYSLMPSVLSTYIKRNFFDVDRGPGDTKYRIFASPFLNKAKKSFVYSFFKWIQAEYIAALKIANKIKETSDNKLIVTKSGVPVKGVHTMKYMMDNPQIDYDGQLMYVHDSTLSMLAEQQSQNDLLYADYENRSHELSYDIDPELHTYNESHQKPPYVNTGGVFKHVKRPTATTSGGKDYSHTNEVCFKALTPPNFKCIDPSCVRIHDKNKIHEMMSKNLKDMMESRSSMHSTEEASLDAVHHDLEANTADHSP